MSLHASFALVLALLAGLSAVGVGWLAYNATATRMLSEIDQTLHEPPAGGGPGGQRGDGRPIPAVARRAFGSEQNVVQVLDADGERIERFSTDGVVLPVNAAEQAIATTGTGENLRSVTASNGREYRVLTRPSEGVALQLGRDLSEMNRVLEDLRARLLIIAAIVIALAAAAGWLAARRLTQSLVELTNAASKVSSTGELDIAVRAEGTDEVGRLATAFSTMLGALARSRDEQQRLVQDAGHELRTPLTSLRTNVDVLRRHRDLPADDRSKVIDDLDVEVAELSALVEEVVAVGSGRMSDEPFSRLALADAVSSAVERVQRRTGRQITVETDSSVVVAQQAQLERAINNLLDNAAKFDGSGAPIAVSAIRGRVAVRDHGPGIATADLSHVFDRFFRSVDARSRPGSGLGLSIVAEVATAHGGSTFAENHPGGGAVVGFQLPTVDPAAVDPSAAAPTT